MDFWTNWAILASSIKACLAVIYNTIEGSVILYTIFASALILVACRVFKRVKNSVK